MTQYLIEVTLLSLRVDTSNVGVEQGDVLLDWLLTPVSKSYSINPIHLPTSQVTLVR